MGSDLIAAKRIAELVAEKTGALIAPTIEAGESSALASFPCIFAMPRKILEDWLVSMWESSLRMARRILCLITGHAGKRGYGKLHWKKYLNEHDIRLVQIDWWRFTNANGSDIFQYSGQMAHGPCQRMRNLCNAVSLPGAGGYGRALQSGADPGRGFPGFHWLGRFTDRTPNGTIGDATVATRKKGEKIVTRCVDRIAAYMEQNFR